MGIYQEIEGDLIKLSCSGMFDVISHGCNCMNNMGAGIAPHMALNFGCDRYELEHKDWKGNINKLGQIDYETFVLLPNGQRLKNWVDGTLPPNSFMLTVVNSYTQYKYGINHKDGNVKPIDYEALTLCMRKINHLFGGQRIGLPGLIGCGLAGGDETIVKEIIKKELKDCDVTIVYLPKIIH